MSVTPQTYVMLAFIPLILWRLYSRVRKLVGRQKSVAWRQTVTVCVFPVILILLAVTSAAQPYALMALASGIAIGVVLGIVGHRTTKFEQTEEGMFYTPNAHLGIALSLLLAGRIAYRFIEVGMMGSGTGAPPPTTTPFTLGLIGMVAGYYVTYAIGLIAWRRANDTVRSS